jgi:membrane fusion protein (multidrug efflux system)
MNTMAPRAAARMAEDADGDGPDTPARLWSRKRLLGLAAVLLAAAGVAYGGHWWWSAGRFVETTDDAYVGGDTTVVAPRVAGFIAQVAVTDNQVVHAGDLLIRLDDRDYRARLAAATARVARARATLANLAAQRRLQGAMVDQARAEIGAHAAEATRARYDLDRYRKLAADRFASVQRFQQAEADYRKAAAGDRAAHAALTASQRKVDVIDTEVGQAAAALDAARAERDLARLNLSYTDIRAPIDGVVGNRSARAGAYAAIGRQLMAIVPARGLWIDANFKEDQLSRLRPGQRAHVAVDVLPGRDFTGHVVSVAPATGAEFSVLPPENATGNFTRIVQRVPVRIALDPESARLGPLRPGLSAQISIDTRDRPIRQAQR